LGISVQALMHLAQVVKARGVDVHHDEACRALR
jgi:hypothetical protein